MSTPRLDLVPDSPEDFAALPGDPFDTGLIARLFQEVAREVQIAPPTPALPPHTQQPVEGLDHVQSYPAQTDAGAPPPVHPLYAGLLEDDAPASPALRSGGHPTEAGEAHAFGEPRCASHAGHREGPHSHPLSPQSGAVTEAGNSSSSSGLYFLRENSAPDQIDGGEKVGRLSTFGAPLGDFNVDAIRLDFPALHQKVNGRQLVWFDNAATTHKPQSVIDATSRFYSRDYSNVNRAAHALAARATELYEGAREKVREFIGAADAKEIVFVRGTTEAINLVAQTFGKQNIRAGDEILLTTMEHHANIVPWKMLAEQTGATIRVAPINDRGELLYDQFVSLLGARTKLVAITHVSNALGTINPVEHIIATAHAYGVPVLVDGAQSTPHLPINVQAMDADFFVFSGHKIFGPTGIGILYGKQALLDSMPPYQGGGSMIQDVTFAKITYNPSPQKFEAGTQDIAGVVGLGAAIDYLLGVGLPAIAAYEHELLEYATAGLATLKGIRPIGTAQAKASVLSFVVPGVDSEDVGRFLDQHGIAVRAGHHCAQPALRRFGVEKAVRPSFAFYNTRAEIDTLIQALHQLPRR